MALQGKLFIKYSWLPNVWSNYLEKIGISCLDWVHWKCRPHTDNYKSTFMTLFMSELGLKYAVKTKYYCNGTLSWFKQICSNKVGWVMTHGGLSESTEHLNLVCIHITKGIHCQNLSTFKKMINYLTWNSVEWREKFSVLETLTWQNFSMWECRGFRWSWKKHLQEQQSRFGERAKWLDIKTE